MRTRPGPPPMPRVLQGLHRMGRKRRGARPWPPFPTGVRRPEPAAQAAAKRLHHCRRMPTAVFATSPTLLAWRTAAPFPGPGGSPAPSESSAQGVRTHGANCPPDPHRCQNGGRRGCRRFAGDTCA